ncbi:all7263 (plasmid) [Nostoc sp. PCC 7120 = FACHB-418]|nr:all7263 [Nostoc sp. PCC 7120 = FACHB-418]
MFGARVREAIEFGSIKLAQLVSDRSSGNKKFVLFEMAYIKLKITLIAMVIFVFSFPTYYSKSFLDWAAKAGEFGSCNWCSETHPFYIATNQEIANFFNLSCLAGGLTFSTCILLLNFQENN